MSSFISAVWNVLPERNNDTAISMGSAVIGTTLAAWTLTTLNPAAGALIGAISMFATIIISNIAKTFEAIRGSHGGFALAMSAIGVCLISKVALGLSVPSAFALAIAPTAFLGMFFGCSIWINKPGL